MAKDVVSFYDEDGNIRTYTLEYLDEGTLSKVYKISDTECLKIFNEEYLSIYDIKALKRLRDFKLDDFYCILVFLFGADSVFRSYTMKFCREEDINILTMPTSYTLDNLYRLFNSFNTLSKEGIYVDDVGSNNVIMDEKNITVIDADLFSYGTGHEKKSFIAKKNYRLLLYLFSDIFFRELRKLKGMNGGMISDMLYDLFDVNKNIGNVEKRLIKYKYPIDYFKGVSKKYGD